jgi:hypothetical protein
MQLVLSGLTMNIVRISNNVTFSHVGLYEEDHCCAVVRVFDKALDGCYIVHVVVD